MNPKIEDLWVNLTVVLPGMVTYAAWRLVIILVGYRGINFRAIDDSLVLSTCLVFAFALLQQTIGISIECLLTRAVTYIHDKKNKLEYAYKLFNRRFDAYGTKKYEGDVLRTIAQFFLSLNITVGQVAILIFIIMVKNPLRVTPVNKPLWLYVLSGLLIFFSICTTRFRYWNAVETIKGAEKKPSIVKQIKNLASR